jgi:trans-aconitate 2-methyltransferase
MWDAGQYMKYSAERARPFFDLLARVPRAPTSVIADLGCGPGNLTSHLAEHWPAARVVGVDNSADMLARAQPRRLPGRLDFLQADIMSWSPEQAPDLIISNAAFQWLPDHEALLARLTELLAAAGTLAVQMPYHFQDPAHLAIEETRAEPRWRKRLAGVGLHQESVRPLRWYVDRLHDLGCAVDAWQTTYLHVLTGPDPVLEWFKGSALRPLLSALPQADQAEFLHQLSRRFAEAYPARRGVTVLPFPRVFFVAQRALGEPA